MNQRKKKAQVLLVEDNLTDATIVRSILEEDESIRVTLAQDGIRGCQLVEGQRWDLVISDLNLPGRDGIEVIQECKAHQPDTPIIATTAYSAPTYREGAFRGGADQVILKPIEKEDLLNTVRDLLIRKAKADAEPRRILAIGTLPGDVEAGCGGVLIKHTSAGDQVTILVLSMGADGEEGSNRRAGARRAAQVIGANLILPTDDQPGTAELDQMVIQIQDAVHTLDPEVVFTPSAQDVRVSRANTFQATEISAPRVPGLYSYQAATTTVDFRPTLFEDISEQLDQKMAALSHFEAQVRGRPHLDPGLARATARYWGRFLGYRDVEPLEVIRHPI